MKQIILASDDDLMIDPKSISTEKINGAPCKFANFTLKRGEKLTFLEPRKGYKQAAICECILPPFVTCFD